MLTGLFFGLCNGIFDFLDLIFDDPCLPFRRKRDFLKLRVADNDGIVVAGCDAGAKTLSIGGFKVFLAGNEASTKMIFLSCTEKSIFVFSA